MSSERMTRISPLSENGGELMSESRVNAWPLYYNAGTGFSVLWPLMDFDEQGWAFRPFYATNNNDRAVLWPLSGWDADSGWGLNSYWRNEAFFGAWPLFHWNMSKNKGGFNYILLFWWENSGKEWGLFPVWGVGENDYRILNFYKSNNGWNFWPLIYRKENKNGTVDWRLLYGVLGASTTDSAWLVPFFYHGKNFTWVFPTFFKTSQWNTVLPFYFYRSLGDDFTLITPLGGLGKYTDGGHFYNLLGPIYIDYKNPSKNYEFASFLWPFYVRSREGNDTYAHTFSLGSKWAKGNEFGRSFLLGLGTTRTKDDQSSWAIWPLYSSRENFMTSDFRYWLTFAGTQENVDLDKKSHWFFPFYYYSKSEKCEDYRFLSYLLGFNFRENRFSNYLFPLWFYDADNTENDKRSELMIPLIYGFDFNTRKESKNQSWEHWALLNLFNFEKDYYVGIPREKSSPYQSLAEKSCYRVLNTFWETREFVRWKDNVLLPREQAVIQNALMHMNRDYVKISSFASETKHSDDFDFDKEIFVGKNRKSLSWTEKQEMREAFFKKELLAILKKDSIELPAGASDEQLLREVKKFAKGKTELLTEHNFQVWPFYESTDDAFGGYEKELLWGVWYSRGNDETYFTSCLKYLYRHERTKLGSKLDVFPFVSIDTGKRGAFSFLGNFFKIVNDDDKGWSGHFLFIPWGEE